MLSLLLTSLNGSERRLELGPDASIAEITSRLKDELPPFHEVRLFQGNRELVEGSTLELVEGSTLEILAQVVTVPSPKAAIDAIEKACAREGQLLYASDDECRIFGEAVSAICKMGELAAEDSDHLLMLVTRQAVADLSPCLTTTTTMPWFLGVLFARSCADTADDEGILLRQKVDLLGEDFVVGALAEFAMRGFQVDQLLDKRVLLSSATSILGDLMFGGDGSYAEDLGPALSSVRVLGRYGDGSYVHLLQSTLDLCLEEEEEEEEEASMAEGQFAFDTMEALWSSCEFMFIVDSSEANECREAWLRQIRIEARAALTCIEGRQRAERTVTGGDGEPR